MRERDGWLNRINPIKQCAGTEVKVGRASDSIRTQINLTATERIFTT